MVFEIFEEKKPIDIKKTIDRLPVTQIRIIECLCTLFGNYGEEKILQNDQILREAQKVFARYSFGDKPNIKDL